MEANLTVFCLKDYPKEEWGRQLFTGRKRSCLNRATYFWLPNLSLIYCFAILVSEGKSWLPSAKFSVNGEVVLCVFKILVCQCSTSTQLKWSQSCLRNSSAIWERPDEVSSEMMLTEEQGWNRLWPTDMQMGVIFKIPSMNSGCLYIWIVRQLLTSS